MRFKKYAGDCNVAPADALVQAEPRRTHAVMAASIGVEDPVDGDEFPTTSGRGAAPPQLDVHAAPVLDNDKMSKLVALMGSEWVAKNLRKFAIDAERELASLDAATTSQLAGIAHGLAGMAGYCGFTELLNVSGVVQREARQGAGLNRVSELRAAGERALAAMRFYTHRP